MSIKDKHKLKHKHKHLIDRSICLLRFGWRREKELEQELVERKAALYRMEKCYLDAQAEIAELRGALEAAKPGT